MDTLTINWKPIETAPKDGTKILLWHKIHKAALTCKYNTAENGLMADGAFEWIEATLTHSWPTAAFTHWSKAIEAPTIKLWKD